MTRTTSARLAGFTFLFYIAVAFPSMVLTSRATAGGNLAARLASVAQHDASLRVVVILTLLSCFCAIVLAVTLYALTRDVDHELALLVLVFRVAEGVIGAVGIPVTLGLVWLAANGATLDSSTRTALGTYFVSPPQSAMIGAPFFAVASLIFSILLLRGRLVPSALAWIGVIASALLVVTLPFDLAGLLPAPWAAYVWFPMLAFEVPLGFWLMFKGVAASGARS